MIQLTATVRINGVVQSSGAVLNLGEQSETDLVRRGLATWLGSDLSATWIQVPHFTRLRLSGNGTVRLDARNRAKIETLNVVTYSVNDAQEVIKFPFLGVDAVEMRITRTGTASCEVLS